MRLLKQFLLHMSRLGCAFSKEIDDYFVEVWAEALEGLTDDNLLDFFIFYKKNGLPAHEDGSKNFNLIPPLIRHFDKKTGRVRRSALRLRGGV